MSPSRYNTRVPIGMNSLFILILMLICSDISHDMNSVVVYLLWHKQLIGMDQINKWYCVAIHFFPPSIPFFLILCLNEHDFHVLYHYVGNAPTTDCSAYYSTLLLPDLTFLSGESISCVQKDLLPLVITLET